MPSSTPKACEKQVVLPLPFLRVCDVQPPPEDTPWLIEDIWMVAGVGLLGGHAKVCKTYLAAELSIAVATGMNALGRHRTLAPGPVLFYGAEDHVVALRGRFEGLTQARGYDLKSLAVYLIDVPVLRLDRQQDLDRLRAAIDKCKPRLLVLDPFVRLVGSIDENSSADVSAILGQLRAIQRDHNVAIILVHHARKSPSANPYQAYRGSSDFAAWSDSNLFLQKDAGHLVLNVEHRSAACPEPIRLRLQNEPAPHLVPAHCQLPASPRPDPLQEEVRRLLETCAQPISTVQIRERLRRRKTDVVTALEKLRTNGLAVRQANGWTLVKD